MAIFWAPVSNSFQLVNQASDGFLDKFLQDDFSALPYMFGAGYCQKVNLNETRSIQWHSDTVGDVVTLRDYVTDSVVATPTTVDVGSGSKQDGVGNSFPFNYYQSDITFGVAGNYYLQISNGGDLLRSEPISVGTYPSTLLIQFTNWRDDALNIWENKFTVGIRVESQLFRRLPSSTNKVFNNTNNFSSISSQRTTRSMQMDYFQLPPYLHVQLGYLWSLATGKIDGQPFYSEEGYSEPSYFDRFNLGNGAIVLNTQKGFNQFIPTAP